MPKRLKSTTCLRATLAASLASRPVATSCSRPATTDPFVSGSGRRESARASSWATADSSLASCGRTTCSSLAPSTRPSSAGITRLAARWTPSSSSTKTYSTTSRSMMSSSLSAPGKTLAFVSGTFARVNASAYSSAVPSATGCRSAETPSLAVPPMGTSSAGACSSSRHLICVAMEQILLSAMHLASCSCRNVGLAISGAILGCREASIATIEFLRTDPRISYHY
mmetsp:Transcript_18918/g.72901  ORF Transcript_18918/g.72901 Transcript_18918/m.72901 type:complete len:225 (+) Transcript_18918:897-1571(+)